MAPDHFGVVLAMLVAAYVLSVLSSEPAVQTTVAVLYLVTLFLAVRTSRPGGWMRVTGRVVPVVGAVAIGVALAALGHRDAAGVTDTVLVVVLAVTIVVVLARVLTRPDVNGSVVAGAVSAYLLLGVLFARVFGVVSWLQAPFFADGSAATAQSLQYFSFTTLTTLGYGDLTAASDAGRGLAMLEALAGQLFLATLIARLVASFHRTSQHAAAASTEVAQRDVGIGEPGAVDDGT